ncbi:MAG: PAS domain S-box protein [Desulfobacteraceae bacterium]|nr:PAS domain S-box protein [Desulfobacteraceae bacterium]
MKKFTDMLLNPENLNLVLDNLKIGIIAHTPERIITVFNKEAERITGFQRDDVIGKDCHLVFESPFCGGKCSFCDSSPDLTDDTKEYPLTIVTKDGISRQLEMTVSPLNDGRSRLKGVVASFSDITQNIDLLLRTENLSSFAGIIGKDKAIQDVFRQIRDVALYNYPVHISGETGTGKERVAYAIHDISSQGNGAFVPVNCGAIPEGIVESELFGHVKGAFSGAVRERKGRFELADKGTLLLDEIAELPLSTQVKLLRFLQEGAFEKVGGEKRVTVDVRIISATNKNLKEEVKAGRFREDLFYRLNVIPIELPPLRKRRSDIPLLATYFLKEAQMESRHKVPSIAEETLELMMDYKWPGNVRELKNIIQFCIVRCRGKKILPSDLPMELIKETSSSSLILENVSSKSSRPVKGKLDVESVKAALKRTGGNKSKAARILAVGRATLYRFLAKNEDIKKFADNIAT